MAKKMNVYKCTMKLKSECVLLCVNIYAIASIHVPENACRYTRLKPDNWRTGFTGRICRAWRDALAAERHHCRRQTSEYHSRVRAERVATERSSRLDHWRWRVDGHVGRSGVRVDV